MGKSKAPVTLNPDKTFLSGGDLGALAKANPSYYQYLTEGADGFNYDTAPTGIQSVHLKGKGNDFNIDWDAITKAHTDAANAAAAAKAASDKAASDAAAATASQQAAAARATAVSGATTKATDAAKAAISAQGINPDDYAGQLSAAIGDSISGLGDTGDLSTINGSNIASNVLNTAQTAQRTKLSNEVSNSFGPNYGNKLISSNLLDDTVNSIINDQKTTAQTYLDAGKKRGIYNDIGYNRGEDIINNDTTAGTSQLGSLANGVISKYRTNADAVASSAASAASGYNLGSNFNLDDYVGQGQGVLSDAQKYGAGDLRTALGGTNYFNLSDIGQGAGQAQGAVNLKDNDLAAALDYSRKQNAVGRGLGSQGAF